jgi:hypothetical protein
MNDVNSRLSAILSAAPVMAIEEPRQRWRSSAAT